MAHNRKKRERKKIELFHNKWKKKGGWLRSAPDLITYYIDMYKNVW